MILVPTELEGAYVLELERHEDERGFFARTWCRRELEEHGLVAEIAQANVAFNPKRGTVRGLHFQASPHEEVKVVSCTRGALYDVIVDLRPGSATFTSWIAVELSAASGRLLYVPKGFAHGYQTLEDGTEASYLISEAYAPESGRGVRWNDPAFGIEWPPVEERIISDKDESWPDFTV